MNLDQRVHKIDGLGYGVVTMVMLPNSSVIVSTGCGDVAGEPVFVSNKNVFSTKIEAFLSDIQAAAKRKLDLANRFNALACHWKRERGISSSLSKAIMSPSYQKIIGMGPDAIPIILNRIKDEGDHPNYWFWALEMLTGENPVSEDDLGDFRAMASAWLSWGYENGKLATR